MPTKDTTDRVSLAEVRERFIGHGPAEAFRQAVPPAFREISTVNLIPALQAAFDVACSYLPSNQTDHPQEPQGGDAHADPSRLRRSQGPHVAEAASTDLTLSTLEEKNSIEARSSDADAASETSCQRCKGTGRLVASRAGGNPATYDCPACRGTGVKQPQPSDPEQGER